MWFAQLGISSSILTADMTAYANVCFLLITKRYRHGNFYIIGKYFYYNQSPLSLSLFSYFPLTTTTFPSFAEHLASAQHPSELGFITRGYNSWTVKSPSAPHHLPLLHSSYSRSLIFIALKPGNGKKGGKRWSAPWVALVERWGGVGCGVVWCGVIWVKGCGGVILGGG